MWWKSSCSILLVFLLASGSAQQCREERSINGKALRGFIFKNFLVTSFDQCNINCEKEMTCQSFNYVTGEHSCVLKNCELNNRTKEARPENFRSDPDRVYIRRLNGRASLGSTAELPAESCQEIKASEGKDAISNKYWLDPTGSGKAVLVYCNMEMEDIDECISGNHDCHVNATCINTIGSHNCRCKEGFTGDGRMCSALKSCTEIYKSGQTTDGVYSIKPDNMSAFDVFCDQTTAGGGWTVFQKRLDGSVDFYSFWNDYKHGFGDLNGEFWLGLDKIHRLTSDDNSMLRVDLEDFYQDTAHSEYDKFCVMNEEAKYKLILGSYSGTAGDSLSYHHNRPWSTRDQDNDDAAMKSCAEEYHGAWWYGNCYLSSLNGFYYHGQHISGEGVIWYHWKNNFTSLKKTEMKIRPTDF